MNYIRLTIGLMLLLLTMFISNTVADDPAYWYLPVGVKARIGKGNISDIKYSPDGEKLAAGSSIGIWLYDANTGDVLSLLAGHTKDVTSIAFSPDGKTLVSASYDDTVRLWDVHTGKQKAAISANATHIAFSPDGKTFAGAGYDVDLWDVQTLKLKAKLMGHRSSRVSVAYSPDGKTIVSEAGRTVQLWDAHTGERKISFTAHEHWVSPMVFSPDSKMLASGGSKDKLVCLWDAQTGENIETFIGHTEGVSSVAFSPDGKTIASGSYDETVRLWDLETGKHETTLTGHSASVYGITFSPDGNTLMSGSGDGTFRAWNPETGELKNTFIHSPNLTYPAISPDGKLLAVGYDKKIQLWETDTGKLKTTLIGHTHPVYSLNFSYDGSTLRSKDREHILVWDVEREKHKQTLPNPPSTISDIKINGRTRVLSPERDILAVGNSDGTIELCDTSTGEQRALFNKHTDRISVIAFSPDGTTLASAADDDTIQLWDPVNMKHIGSLEDMVNGSSVLAFSEDGTFLAGGSRWGDVGLWNLQMNSYIPISGHRSPGGSDSISSFAFSKDHTTFVSTSTDNTIRLWDTATGGYKGVLVGHTNSPYFVVFANDDNTLVSKGSDGTILLWDTTPSVDTDAFVSITPTLVDSPISGEHLTFSIDIDDGKNITGYQIFLEYDTSVLRYLSTKNGDYLSGEISSQVKVAYPSFSLVNQHLSMIEIASTHQSKGHNVRFKRVGKSTVSGAGSLAKVTFEILTKKPTSLRLPKVKLVRHNGIYAIPAIKNASLFASSHTDVVTNNDPRFDPVIGPVHTLFSLPKGAVGRLGKGAINDIAFSPDGSLFVVAGSAGIWLYDAGTGEELALLTGHTAPVMSIAFSPHGNVLASGSQDGIMQLWNPWTSELLATLENRSRFGTIKRIDKIAFSAEGSMLAGAHYGNGNMFWVWNPHTGERIRYFESDRELNHSRNLTSKWEWLTFIFSHRRINSPVDPLCAFIADKSYEDKKNIQLLDTQTGELRITLSGHTKPINSTGFNEAWVSLAFSHDGKILASASLDETVRLWNTLTGENIATYEARTDRIDSLAFSPDGTILATAGCDGEIRLLGIKTESPRLTLTGHTDAVSSIAFSPDSQSLACGSETGKTYLWDMKTRQSNLIHKDDRNVAHYVSFAPDGLTLASTGKGGTSLYDVRTLQHKAILPEVGGSVFTFSPDGQTIASARGHSIRIADSRSGDHDMTFWGHLDDVLSLAYSPDGEILSSSGRAGPYKENPITKIRLWDTKTGVQRLALTENICSVGSIAFSPDGETLASTHWATAIIKLWEVSTGKHISTLNAFSKGESSKYISTSKIVYSPDGTTLAAIVRKDDRYTINVWDVETKKRSIIQPNHVLPITTLAYSPDGTTLASGSQDGTVLLWKMRSSPVTRLNITPLTVETSPIGKHLTFNVNMSDAQNVTGFQFGLQYDSESLRFIPNTENATDNNIKPSLPIVDDNVVTFSGNATEGSIIADGTIAAVTFEVLKHADVTLTITDAHLTHDNGGRSRPVVGHAWLVEPERIPEDVNRDWQLNAANLEFVSSRIGQSGLENDADVNKDGQVDIADLVLVRNALYGSQLGTESD